MLQPLLAFMIVVNACRGAAWAWRAMDRGSASKPEPKQSALRTVRMKQLPGRQRLLEHCGVVRRLAS